MGAPCFMGAGRASAITLGQFQAPLSVLSNFDVSDANALITARVAATVSNMGALLDANGTARVTMFRKNNADTTLSPTITDSTLGAYYDTTHSVALAVNDTFDLNLRGTAPAYLPYCVYIQHQTAAGVAASNYYGTGNSSLAGIGAGPDYFGAIAGGFSTTESLVAITMRAPGTESFLTGVVTTAAGATLTLTSRKNSAAGNQTVTIGSGSTGQFVDTTHSDSYVAGDTLSIKMNCSTPGSCRIQTDSFIQFTGTDTELSTSQTAWAFNASNQFTALLSGGGVYLTTEASTQMKLGIAGTLSKWRQVLSANTAASTVTFTLRKNTASGNSTLAVGAATTGAFEDTTHSDSFVASDLLNFMAAGGTSGAITVAAALMMMSRISNSQTVSVTCASSVALVKQAGKTIAVGCASTVSLANQAGKTIAIGCASAVTMARQALKNIAVSCASTVTIATQKFRTATINVTSTSTTTIAKATSKLIAVTSASSTLTSRSTAKSIQVACSSAVTMARQTGKQIALTCASTVTMTRNMAKAIAVSCASAVSATLSTAKTVVAACASAVTLLKSALKPIAVTSATSTSMTRLTGKNVAVTAASTVMLSRSMTHTVAVACSSLVSMLKASSTTLSVSCASAVSLSRRALKSIAVVAISTVTIGKAIVQQIQVTCASAVSQPKKTFKSVAVACASAVTIPRLILKLLAIAATSLVTIRKVVSHSIFVTCAATVSVTVGFFLTILVTCSTLVVSFRMALKIVRATCSSAVTRSLAIGKMIIVLPKTTIHIQKFSTRTVSVSVTTTVSIIAHFILTVIRTKIFGRASAPIEIEAEGEIFYIAGRSSSVHVDGFPEPLDPDTEF